MKWLTVELLCQQAVGGVGTAQPYFIAEEIQAQDAGLALWVSLCTGRIQKGLNTLPRKEETKHSVLSKDLFSLKNNSYLNTSALHLQGWH